MTGTAEIGDRAAAAPPRAAVAETGLDRAVLGGKRRMILIEFNELCPWLLDKWMEEGHLPNFKALHDSSQVFVTEADAERVELLEPWIQWYDVHTGLAYDQHHVFHLTDGAVAGHPDLWRTLIDHGKTVGNCSSMNARSFSSPGSYFIPDPWCTTESASPAEINDFYRVVARSVQEYTNESTSLTKADYAKFAMFLLRHGLRPGTVAAIVGQLAADKLVDRKLSWKRPAVLDRILFDVFRHYQTALRPDFATYFANSTAHLQHAYWRHMDPAPFEIRPPESEMKTYGKAVFFGYVQMDRLIGEFLRLADDDVMLVFATALSQQPFLREEQYGGSHFYRLKNPDAFLDMLEVPYVRTDPVMTNQYVVTFADGESASRGKQALASVTCNGKEIFDFDNSQENRLLFGNGMHRLVADDAPIEVGGRPVERTSYKDLFYLIPEIKSGRHHPDGALWFRTGRHFRHDGKVSVLDVFPTVLEFFGIAPPAGNGLAYRGRSRLPEFT